MKSKATTALVWLALVALFLGAFQLLHDRPITYQESFETFLEHVEAGHVSAVRVEDNVLTVTLKDSGFKYMTLGLLDDELIKTLSRKGIVVSWGAEPQPVRTLLMMGLPLIVVLGLVLFFIKRAGAGTTNILSLTKTKARLIPEPSRVRFTDVGGAAEAKERLGDVIDFLKNPTRWLEAGARLPHGLLLEGPPGCGKTLIARAVAGEADARFFVVSASEFVEMFVGVGAARVRDTFETAAKQAPAVIFIDELDAVGRRRGSGIGAAHDEREQTLNQLLVCLDGFQPNDRVVVLAATNRPDILDKALLRPGRFDCRIKIPELTREDRLETLKIHTRKKPLGDDISLEELAEQTSGFTGADLESLANEAALQAVRHVRATNGHPPKIGMADFRRAMKLPTANQRFNTLEALLVESASQLAQPTGKVVVRLTLREGTVVEGEVSWADASFIKVRTVMDDTEVIVPKAQVTKVEALEGTEWAAPDDVVQDRWGRHMPGLA
jgi:cell division protease FtsH